METVICQLSFRDVLHTRERLGHIDRIYELAKQLGYPYFLWNDRVFKLGAESRYVDTGLTVSDVV